MPLVRLSAKECLEDLLAARGFLQILVASLVLSGFAVMLVSNTELSLLDEAQALYMMTAVVLTLTTLMVILRGSDSFAGECDRGTLETLLLTPLSGEQLAVAKLLGMLFSWLLLFVLSLPYLWAIDHSWQHFFPAWRYLALTGTLLVVIFGAGMISLSARTPTFKGVLSLGLTLFLLAGSPVVLAPAWRQSAIGKAFDLLNPLADAVNTLDSVIIDQQALAFQLLRLSIMIAYGLAALALMATATRRVAL